MNCGHRLSELGPDDTLDLYLDISTKQKIRLGECKLSIAANQGTGGDKFPIAPSKREESKLIYRMASINPSKVTRELRRSLVHDEAVALISY